MNYVALKELRENMDKYAHQVQKGKSFVVMKRSKPLFEINPVNEQWEEVVDFTKYKKNGILVDELIKRLK
ncbi:hypothetical protein IT409_01410 [Candidatus Falkowbacteria bacterium]|nr:hypothetical protein [Candidatus Falkowbacteria bacterium]